MMVENNQIGVPAVQIFFTASLRGKEVNYQSYKRIYDVLIRDHQVFAEHVFDLTKETIKQWSADYHFEYYQKILAKIKTTDLIVAEVTYPSINIGYEISLALEQRKHVIALYTGTSEPTIFQHLESDFNHDRLSIIQYERHNLENQLTDTLQYIKKNLTQRFTLLLPYKVMVYLEEVSRDKRISKSYFIRKLIDQHMLSNSPL